MLIALHIVPKASKSEIIGWVDGADGKKALKVRVCAPPEDGKANKELLKFLAKTWGVKVASLELVSGEKSRHKRLKIHDSELAAQLASQLS